MNRCRVFVPIVYVVVLLVLAGCSGKKEGRVHGGVAARPGDEQRSDADLLQARMERLHHFNAQRALRGPTTAPRVDLIELDRAKKLLPEQLLDMRRESLTAETEKLSHLSMAELVTRYARDAGRSVQVAIVDLAGMMHLAGLPVLPWVSQEIDEETEIGYVKTFSLYGHKGLEEYDGDARNVHIQLLLNGRLLVEIRGRGVDPDEGTVILQALPLRGLADLAKALPGSRGYIDARPSPSGAGGPTPGAS